MLNTSLLPPDTTFAIALSGGSDSMALLLLMQDFVKAGGGDVIALTVDHGLRPESAEEAAQVKRWAEALGILHHTLVWEGEKPSANLQENARLKRYTLLTQWCHAHNVNYLLTAHHLDDQAETVALRLARGSGVDGLSGILPMSYQFGICILRPLLDVTKAQLQAFLQQRGQGWVEDPTNQQTDYSRNALRAALNTYADAPLISKRLADTAKHMARVRDYLEIQTKNAEMECVKLHPEGYATLDSLAYFALHEEIALRLLSNLLETIGKKGKKPRFSSLERLYHALKLQEKTTLHGCVITYNPADTIFLFQPELDETGA